MSEIDRIRRELAHIASERPTAVLLAMLDQLVDVACGTNAALQDVMRLQFYRGVMRKLASRSELV